MLKCVKGINCTSWSILFWVKVTQNFNMTDKIQSSNSSCDSGQEKSPDFGLSNNASLFDWQGCFCAILSLTTWSTQGAAGSQFRGSSWWPVGVGAHPGLSPTSEPHGWERRGCPTSPPTPWSRKELSASVLLICFEAAMEISLDHFWHWPKHVTFQYM